MIAGNEIEFCSTVGTGENFLCLPQRDGSAALGAEMLNFPGEVFRFSHHIDYSKQTPADFRCCNESTFLKEAFGLQAVRSGNRTSHGEEDSCRSGSIAEKRAIDGRSQDRISPLL